MKKSFTAGLFIVVCFISLIQAQNSDLSNQTANSNANSAAAVTASPTPVPFSEIVTQTATASVVLRQISSEISADLTVDTVESGLPALTEEIIARIEETAQVTQTASSLDKLKGFESDWRSMTLNLPKWKNDLTARARKLEDDLKQIDELSIKWKKTLEELNTRETPPEVIAKVQEIIQTADATRREIESRQARVVSLQNKIAEQQARVNDALASVRQTREVLVGQLFVRDSPPIWDAGLYSSGNILSELTDALAVQFNGLSAFILRNTDKLAVHFLVFGLLVVLFAYLRKEAGRRTDTEPELRKSAKIFYFPAASAIILAILFNSQIYPQSPRILGSIFGAIAIIPAVIILRNLVERSLYPILYLLVGLFFVDQIRAVADSVPLITRPIFLLEMTVALTAFVWFYRNRLSPVEEETAEKEEAINLKKDRKIFRVIRIAALVMIPFFAAAFLANVFGYLNLAKLVGNAVLRSAYTALVLYAAVRIIDGLIVFALRSKPLNLLKMVQDYAPEIQRKLEKTVRFAAPVIWISATLDFLTLRETIFENLRNILTAELKVGSVSFSAWDVILFFLVVWAAFLLSRFIRFVLEEDIYPRLALAHGIPYAISTILNYVILLAGFFFAVGVAGFDLTKFTILVGAFGVGVGFGLQNIVNNFVSGLILLFERPVKIGDDVKIGDAGGTVQNIGIRASLIRQWDNSEVIVPNSKLISENVQNKTAYASGRGIEIPVNVVHGTNARRIKELLLQTASEHPLIAQTPKPQVLITELNNPTLNFRLRVWTKQFNKILEITGDLTIAIAEKFAENDIAIVGDATNPTPSRESDLKS